MHGIRAFEGFDGDSAILYELCADPVIPFCSGIVSALDYSYYLSCGVPESWQCGQESSEHRSSAFTHPRTSLHCGDLSISPD